MQRQIDAVRVIPVCLKRMTEVLYVIEIPNVGNFPWLI